MLKVPDAIKLSKLTVQNIQQNLLGAFFYNTIGIPVAAGLLYPLFGVLLNPMFAGFAMAMSSVTVVTNANRLRWISLDSKVSNGFFSQWLTLQVQKHDFSKFLGFKL